MFSQFPRFSESSLKPTGPTGVAKPANIVRVVHTRHDLKIIPERKMPAWPRWWIEDCTGACVEYYAETPGIAARELALGDGCKMRMIVDGDVDADGWVKMPYLTDLVRWR